VNSDATGIDKPLGLPVPELADIPCGINGGAGIVNRNRSAEKERMYTVFSAELWHVIIN
jgi:hypothetical protein